MKMLGSKPYIVAYSDRVIAEDIPDLPRTMKALVKKAIEERLMVDPLGFGKPLRYSLKGFRSLRVGDYRIVYNISATDKEVFIVVIKHRKDVYEYLQRRVRKNDVVAKA
jgi:mRNA interferase RelE/StbE